MATITWNISQLDCRPQENDNTNVVFTVHWQCNGVDGSHNANIYSTCSVPAPTGEFTPFADLTKEQVLNWIWVNGVNKDAIEVAVELQIENLKNPPVVSPALPWV
jgi:hypothetical protein